MKPETYRTLVAVLFFVIGAMHLSRIVFGWEVSVSGWAVPFWLSWLALIVSWVVSFIGFAHIKKE